MKWIKAIWTGLKWLWKTIACWIAKPFIKAQANHIADLQQQLKALQDDLKAEKMRSGMAKFELEATIETKVHRWIAQQRDYNNEIDIEAVRTMINKLYGLQSLWNEQQKRHDLDKYIEQAKMVEEEILPKKGLHRSATRITTI